MVGETPTWKPSNCIRCGLCVGVCPVGAISLRDGNIEIDVNLCTACGTCVKACPVAALLLLGGDARER